MGCLLVRGRSVIDGTGGIAVPGGVPDGSIVEVGRSLRPDGDRELDASGVSASAAGAHLEMMCAAGDTTHLSTRHVRQRGDLSVERAVHELTGRRSDVFGFTDRGRIVPGAHADLTVFALNNVAWSDEEFLNDVPEGGGPMRRPSAG
jgi:N-acyl-D-aspartate/D-glutamate deacylase